MAEKPVKRGFGWKRMGDIHKADAECVSTLKGLIRKLPELREYCRYFEARRKSLLTMAEIEEGEITFLNVEKIKELMGLPMSEEDKKALFAYFDASTQIMVLETGMEGLPEGQYREIAYDRYFERMSYKEIMQKHSVNKKTVQRALGKTKAYLLTYSRWYLDLAGKVKESINQ